MVAAGLEAETLGTVAVAVGAEDGNKRVSAATRGVAQDPLLALPFPLHQACTLLQVSALTHNSVAMLQWMVGVSLRISQQAALPGKGQQDKV